MTRKILPALVALGFAAFPLLTSAAQAEDQKAPQLHIRGTVETFSASVLKVKTREGETLDVTLADGWKISAVARAQVTDIKPGDFVGIASQPKAEGGDGALEVPHLPAGVAGRRRGKLWLGSQARQQHDQCHGGRCGHGHPGADRNRVLPWQGKEDLHP